MDRGVTCKRGHDEWYRRDGKQGTTYECRTCSLDKAKRRWHNRERPAPGTVKQVPGRRQVVMVPVQPLLAVLHMRARRQGSQWVERGWAMTYEAVSPTVYLSLLVGRQEHDPELRTKLSDKWRQFYVRAMQDPGKPVTLRIAEDFCDLLGFHMTEVYGWRRYIHWAEVSTAHLPPYEESEVA